jgi:putative transposase
VSRHEGDRYIKDFSSWDHLVSLVFAQLGGLSSLREVAAVWNAQGAHHYHLGSGPVCRSTLSDANRRRPSAIFAEAFGALTELACRSLRHDGKQILRLIDATPIPLTSLHKWPDWNGRTRGLKAHVTYDPDADRPVRAEITPASVNDVVAGRRQPIEPGATYVFDKAYVDYAWAYVDYAWWRRLHEAGCRFITRPKTNVHATSRRVGSANATARSPRSSATRWSRSPRSSAPGCPSDCAGSSCAERMAVGSPS